MYMPKLFNMNDNFVDRFFEDFARPVFPGRNFEGSVMKTDIAETADGYNLTIDLPGYKKEDIHAELKDGYLTVSADTSNTTEDKENGNFIRRERFYGTCRRNFYVGEAVTEEDIQAKFEDGVLKVHVPKKELKPAIEEAKHIAIA